MAIAEVGGGTQRATATGTNVDSANVAFPSNVAADSLLLVMGVSWQGGTGNTGVTVSDTRSTSYTVLLGAGFFYAGGTVKPYVAYGIAPTSGACTVTVDPSGSSNYMQIAIDEFSGVNTSTPLDVDGGETVNIPVGSTTPSGSFSTGTDNALVAGVLAGGGIVSTITPGTGYTQIGEDEAVTTQNYSAEFKIAGSAGSQTVDWTFSVGQPWAVYTASFKEAGGVDSSMLNNPIFRPRLRSY